MKTPNPVTEAHQSPRAGPGAWERSAGGFGVVAEGKSTGDGGKQTNKTLNDCVGVTSHLRILSQLDFYRLLIGKRIETFRNALVPPAA